MKNPILSENVDLFGIPNSVIVEMANLGFVNTGLPKVIHIWSGGQGSSHGARVKASFFADRFDLSKNVSISVSDEPVIVAPKNFKFHSDFSYQDFLKVKKFIILNQEILKKYWCDSSLLISDVQNQLVKYEK